MAKLWFGSAACRWIAARAWVAAITLCANSAAGEPLEISAPFSVSDDYATGDTFMNVRLQGTVRLLPEEINGLKPRELSGLAWDADEGLLYAVSDDGFLVHLRPEFHDGVLLRVYLEGAYPLLEHDGAAVKKKYADAEGLVARHTRNGIDGDSELVVSFEQQPRLVHYTPDGRYLTTTPLPQVLRDSARYSGRNKELEGLTELDDFGLITAPERPLKDADQSKIPLYSSSGHTWLYAPFDAEYSALVGLESMPGGDLLVLERRFASVFRPVVFSLRRMHMDTPTPAAEPPVKDVARFDTTAWTIDNFEGVAWHEGSNYFMVSDDNESVIQKTLLMYFEIRDTAPETVEIDGAPDLNTPSNAASARRDCRAACGNRAGG